MCFTDNGSVFCRIAQGDAGRTCMMHARSWRSNKLLSERESDTWGGKPLQAPSHPENPDNITTIPAVMRWEYSSVMPESGLWIQDRRYFFGHAGSYCGRSQQQKFRHSTHIQEQRQITPPFVLLLYNYVNHIVYIYLYMYLTVMFHQTSQSEPLIHFPSNRRAQHALMKIAGDML